MNKMDEEYRGWGEGWDYMLRDIWDRLDMIRADNLVGNYNATNIEFCFYYIYKVLVEQASVKVINSDWSEEDKKYVLGIVHRLINIFAEAVTLPDKVIAITVGEQLLRQTY